MSDAPPIGAFAIVPSNDLLAAIPFWERLGFARTGGDHQRRNASVPGHIGRSARTGGDHQYAIMSGWDCEVHLTQAGGGPWRVPAENNPFGVFIRTPHVDAITARVDDLIIRPGGILRHREWGMYEVGIAGPDGLLVRVGWPSDLVRAG